MHNILFFSAYTDAMSLCKGDFVFLMDADMSHHPKHIPDFIKKQKETGAGKLIDHLHVYLYVYICMQLLSIFQRKIFFFYLLCFHNIQIE